MRKRSLLFLSLLVPAFLVLSGDAVKAQQQGSTSGKRWSDPATWPDKKVPAKDDVVTGTMYLPVNREVDLTLRAQDVIHSFFIPAFRMKKDVLPGRYTTAWFRPTKAGTYHLFCAEYCGTKHSGMIGTVTVMEPAAFQTWLARGATGTSLAAPHVHDFGTSITPGLHRLTLRFGEFDEATA